MTSGEFIVTLIRAVSVVFLAAPVFAQEAGPSILLRGEPVGEAPAQRVVFRPFMEFAGVYDTGLYNSGVTVNAPGGAAASAGLEFTGGLTGGHSWEHTTFGLDYRGSIYRYVSTAFFNNSEHRLALGFAHQFSRHSALTLRENVGTFSGYFGMQGAPPVLAGLLSYVLTTDYSVNRTTYLATEADFTVQKSARLSFNMGGYYGSVSRRSSTALYGVAGAGARGDVQYRLPRRSTIGVGYTYDHYGYQGVYGSTDIHSVLGTYAILLPKKVEFTAYGGIMRDETQYDQLAPAPSRASRVDYVPNIKAGLSQTYHQGLAYITGGHTVSPGSGLYVTAAAIVANAGYTYTGSRRWTFNAEAEYYRTKAIAGLLGYYDDIGGTVSASRLIGRYVHAFVGLGVRQFQTPDLSQRNGLIYQARIGLGFTPRDIPLRVW